MVSSRCKESWAVIREMCCDACLCTQKEWYLVPFYSYDGKTLWGQWLYSPDDLERADGAIPYLAVSEDKIPVWESDFRYVFDYASSVSGREIKTPYELTEWFKQYLDEYLPEAHSEEHNRIIALIQNGIHAQIGGGGKYWWIHDDYTSMRREQWVTYDRIPDSKYDMDDVLHHYTRHFDHGKIRYVREGLTRHSVADLVSARQYNTQQVEAQKDCSYLPYKFLDIQGLPPPSRLAGTYELEYLCYDDGTGVQDRASDAQSQWCQGKYCSPNFGTTEQEDQVCMAEPKVLKGGVADIFIPAQLHNIILGDTYNLCFTPKYLEPSWTLRHETCILANPNDNPDDPFAPKIKYAGSKWEATSDSMGVMVDIMKVAADSPYFNCDHRYVPLQITEYTVRPEPKQVDQGQAVWSDDKTSLELDLDCEPQNQLPDDIWISHGVPVQPEFGIQKEEDRAVKVIEGATALKYKRYASTHALLVKQDIDPYSPLPDYPDEVYKRNLAKELEHRLNVIESRKEEIQTSLTGIRATLKKLQDEWNVIVSRRLAELNAAKKELDENSERIQTIETALVNGWYPTPDTILADSDKVTLIEEKETKEKRNTELELRIIPDLQFIYDNTRQGSQEIKDLVRVENGLVTELESYNEQLISDNIARLSAEIEDIWDNLSDDHFIQQTVRQQINAANESLETNQQRITAIEQGMGNGISPDTGQELTAAEYQMLQTETHDLELHNKEYESYIKRLEQANGDGFILLKIKREELREWRRKQRQFTESDDDVWDILDNLEEYNESLMEYCVNLCSNLGTGNRTSCIQRMVQANVIFDQKIHTRIPYSWVSTGVFGGYASIWKDTAWEKLVGKEMPAPHYTADGTYSWGNPLFPVGGTVNCDVPETFREGGKLKFSDDFVRFVIGTEPWLRLSEIWLEFYWVRELVNEILAENRTSECVFDYYDPSILNPNVPLEKGKCYSISGMVGHTEVSYAGLGKCEAERKEVEMFDAAGRLLQAQSDVLLLYYPVVKNPMSCGVHSYMWKHPIGEYVAVYRSEDSKQVKVLTKDEYAWEAGDPSTRTNLDISVARGFKEGQSMVGRHAVGTSRLTLGGMECLSHFVEKGLVNQRDSEDSVLHQIQEEINQLQGELAQTPPGSGEYVDLQNRINDLSQELMRVKNEPEETRYRSQIDWENRIIPLSAISPVGIVGKTMLYQVSGFAPSTPRLTYQTHYISDWRKKNDPLVNKYYYPVTDGITGQTTYHLKEGSDLIYSPVDTKSVRYWQIIDDSINKWQKKIALPDNTVDAGAPDDQDKPQRKDEHLWVDDPDHAGTTQFLCWFDGKVFIQKPYLPEEPIGGLLLKSEAHCYTPTLSSRAPENTKNTNTEDFDIYNPLFRDRKNGIQWVR